MEFSLSPGERQRLASLLAAVATPLLLLFAFTVVLPLLPPRPADPLWQLALCSGLCGSGALALLAVLLVQLGAALEAIDRGSADPGSAGNLRNRQQLGQGVSPAIRVPLWAGFQGGKLQAEVLILGLQLIEALTNRQ